MFEYGGKSRTCATVPPALPDWCADPSLEVMPAPVRPSQAVQALQGAVESVCAAGVEELADVDPAVLEAEVVALARVAARLETAWLARLGVADGRGAGRADGAVSTRAWLADRAGMDPARAGAAVGVARRLRELPVVLDAALQGRVTAPAAATVAALADLRHPDLVAAAQEVQPELVELAAGLPLPRLRTQVARLKEALAPDVVVADAEQATERRRLDVSRLDTCDGMVAMDGMLEREVGELLVTCMQAQLSADRVEGDGRSPGQRRHDALAQILRGAAGAGTVPLKGGVRPHLVVVADLDTLLTPDAAGRARAAVRRTAAARGTEDLPVESAWTSPANLEAAGNAAIEEAATEEAATDDIGTDEADVGRDDTGERAAVAERRPDAPEAVPSTLAHLLAPGGLAPDGLAAGGLALGGLVLDGLVPNGLVPGEVALGRLAPGGIGGSYLPWSGPLHAQAARRLGCDALLTTVLTDGPGRVLNVGRTSRIATSAQRAALLVRDGGCRFPGCDRPPDWCEAHHILHWADGGRTDLINLILLCWAHHRYVHERGWSLRLRTDGIVDWTRPDGSHLTSEPSLRFAGLPAR